MMIVIIRISDDPQHDTALVWQFESKALDLLSQYTTVKRITEFTNGCAAQYKGCSGFANISLQQGQLERHFFETSHGKNVCDGWEPCWRITAIRLWSAGKLYFALPLMSTIMQLHICLSLLNWQKSLEVQESWSCQHDNTSTLRQKMWTMMTRIWMFRHCRAHGSFMPSKTLDNPTKYVHKTYPASVQLVKTELEVSAPTKNMLGNGKINSWYRPPVSFSTSVQLWLNIKLLYSLWYLPHNKLYTVHAYWYIYCFQCLNGMLAKPPAGSKMTKHQKTKKKDPENEPTSSSILYITFEYFT